MDSTEVQASLISGPNRLEHGQLPAPKLGPGHILIETAFVGICGTDIHLLNGDSFYLEHKYLSYPFVFGHEYTGQIVELADDVTNLGIGDRVVGHCMVPCHFRNMCRYEYHGFDNPPGVLTKTFLVISAPGA
jgi:L-iditol 2-dehydrogenase